MNESDGHEWIMSALATSTLTAETNRI